MFCFAGAGFKVIMPDYYRGAWQAPHSPGWWSSSVIRHSGRYWGGTGRRRFGLMLWSTEELRVSEWLVHVGGSYMTMRLSSYPEVMAAVSMHPSHSLLPCTVFFDLGLPCTHFLLWAWDMAILSYYVEEKWPKIWQNSHIAAPEPKIKKIKALCFLQL